MLNVLAELFLISAATIAGQGEPLNVKKYMGLWYEIYSIPQNFQEGCFNITAEYSLNDNGTIRVVNTCRDADGKFVKSIKGQAVLKSLSKKFLKVYFYRPFGLNIFGGDYYILALEKNYQWAIVGTPNHKYGWVLSRHAHLQPEEQVAIQAELKRLGFDWHDFKKTTTK